MRGETMGNDENEQNKFQWLETFFIIIMFLCLLIAILALGFFLYSQSTLNSMVDESVLNGLKVSEDVSIEGYLNLQKQLQEIRSSAIETNTLTFLYQFISGTLIGVAGYLIKLSTDRLKEADKKIGGIKKRLAVLTSSSQIINEKQKQSLIVFIETRIPCHVNSIYSSLQNYIYLSNILGSVKRQPSPEGESQCMPEGEPQSSPESAPLPIQEDKFLCLVEDVTLSPQGIETTSYALDAKKELEYFRCSVNQEIHELCDFCSSSFELMNDWPSSEKLNALRKMHYGVRKVGEILKKDLIKPEKQYKEWEKTIATLLKKIRAKIRDEE